MSNKVTTWVIGAIAVIALVISIENVQVGGNKTTNLGGITNFDTLRLDAIGIGTNPSVSTAEAIINGTGTTTLALTGTKGCINLINTQGSSTALYIIGSGTATNAWGFAVGTCK
jgi:hypothetical protein